MRDLAGKSGRTVCIDFYAFLRRGRGRRRAHVDALSNDTGDTEIPTTDRSGRGRVGV